MYTMPPLTQVLREGERGKTGERRRNTGTIVDVFLKTGAGDRKGRCLRRCCFLVFCENLCMTFLEVHVNKLNQTVKNDFDWFWIFCIFYLQYLFICMSHQV